MFEVSDMLFPHQLSFHSKFHFLLFIIESYPYMEIQNYCANM